jgi:hypothetical protein
LWFFHPNPENTAGHRIHFPSRLSNTSQTEPLFSIQRGTTTAVPLERDKGSKKNVYNSDIDQIVPAWRRYRIKSNPKLLPRKLAVS